MPNGFVWIVGAGPGDARLLTLKAKECLERADVVVYDRLLTPSVMAFIRSDAELIYAGKAPGGVQPLPQSAINELLIAKAREGKKVVRLKNGDPFVFGRGAEEAEALAQAGIPFEIVPGLSSVFTVPAYAGIPLTDRRYASSFAVAAGHGAEGKPTPFQALAAAETVVALMAVSELPRIVAELLDGGKDPQTPAAVIEWGATPRQRTLVAPLAQLPDLARRHQVQPPAVLVVGEVVRLRERIAWYERKPLFGKRVLVTRAEEQAEALASKLEDLGAEAIRLPLIKIVPVDDEAPLNAALERALQGGYDWIVFTSTHGVRTFFERVWQRGADARVFASTKFAVIGPATGDALRQWGICWDAMPERYTNEGLSELLTTQVVSAATRPPRFLLWRAHGAREVLAHRLRQAGAQVDEVYAYRTVPTELPPDYLAALLRDPIHIITFTSPSTVQAFFAVLGEARATQILQNAAIAVIGPVTEQAVRQRGFVPAIVSAVHTIDGLVDALTQSPLVREKGSTGCQPPQ
ncbi:Uroporphyrinogen-III C-methyltransferase [bacterium HR17]|uniref:uroporphyrinogen-III C-methyltransferase n=1 Tax=Candidatus Fervidibacter japonicus TaxID=2035412 RepID=A0A2H5XCJ0_9BACT|nr:Uroporphyrinogen-III C-methyltransferase [bacterium HR17]